MGPLVLSCKEMGKTENSLVGGKGFHLTELSKIPDIQVPDWFCVTTVGYQKVLKQNEAFQALVDQLYELKSDDRDRITEVTKKIREVIVETEIPSDVANAVAHQLSLFGDEQAYAVRSSATAEDLPHTSFAGQQDTYLNINGKEAILQHISKCWASLFTDRAVIYRMQNGFDHRQVYLSVIVQKMVFSQASGILFTADPITSNRKRLFIEAGYGLGEALVSGLASADCYKVQEGEIVDKQIIGKKLAVYGRKEGGTETQPIEPDQQKAQTLTDPQILQLAHIGRHIEDSFGSPQVIEWCLVDDTFYIVQSRPITTLFPIPEADDQENHIYLSVGHQQMMTDAMKPLGISMWQLTAARPMFKAGGRLFVDVARQLASPDSREILLDMMGQHEPLFKDALMTLINRGDFIKSKSEQAARHGKRNSSEDFLENFKTDPKLTADLIKRSETSIEALKHNIQTKFGAELFDFILENIEELKKILFDPQSSALIRAAMDASAWINEKMSEWLGEKKRGRHAFSIGIQQYHFGNGDGVIGCRGCDSSLPRSC